MNRLKLIALAFLFSFAITSCEKDNSLATNDVQNIDFALTGNQVVPASNSNADGTIRGTYSRKSKTFTYTLEWDGLSSNITSMHIHGVADRGFVAIPIAPLAANPNGIVQNITGYSSSAASGSISNSLLVDGTVIKEEDLLAGKFHVDIHTTNYPGGEIRGQILFPN